MNFGNIFKKVKGTVKKAYTPTTINRPTGYSTITNKAINLKNSIGDLYKRMAVGWTPTLPTSYGGGGFAGGGGGGGGLMGGDDGMTSSILSPTAFEPFKMPTPAPRRAFSEVLPFEKVFNQGLVSNMVENQINPEMARLRNQVFYNQGNEMAGSGMFRTGRAQVERQATGDAIERQRKERVSGFGSDIKDWLSNWYNQQSELYGKNPSSYVMPTLPKYESNNFINSLYQ